MEFIKYDAPLSGEIKGIDLNNFISSKKKKILKNLLMII